MSGWEFLLKWPPTLLSTALPRGIRSGARPPCRGDSLVVTLLNPHSWLTLSPPPHDDLRSFQQSAFCVCPTRLEFPVLDQSASALKFMMESFAQRCGIMIWNDDEEDEENKDCTESFCDEFCRQVHRIHTRPPAADLRRPSRPRGPRGPRSRLTRLWSQRGRARAPGRPPSRGRDPRYMYMLCICID